MSYLQQDDTKLLYDINTRKEFYWHKRWNNNINKYDDFIPRYLLDHAISKGSYLILSSYQRFVRNFINPNTPYQRLLLKWQTGVGKSIGALSIAMNFIKNYRLEKENNSEEIGTIFIIGFSEKVFKNELLRFPAFGFLSRTERRYLDKLQRIAAMGTKEEVGRYKDMTIRIKKRFGNRKGNGFFKFYGYKAFVNKLFVYDSKEIDINKMSEEQIRGAIAKGVIKYNEEILNQFKNSLIICDEIHNVYNSNEKNNWGVAIQTVLDHEPTCRAVFATATPINNNPTEIIDLANLLLTKEQRLKKEDFFSSNGSLKNNALQKLSTILQGRISYVRDVNPAYYPSIDMNGESLQQIDYLKFIRCPMSSFHYNTYQQVYKGT
jgi:superfamily II DNA or RNA helicase